MIIVIDAIEKAKNLSKNCLDNKYTQATITDIVKTPERYNTFIFKPKNLNKKALYKYANGP